MISTTAPLNSFRALLVALLLVFVGGSCVTPLSISVEKPDIPTIQVTQLATILVTQEVTQEVTRIVEVPVTVTPPANSLTPAPSFTSTGSPPLATVPESLEVRILEHSDCLYGPGSGYLYKYSVAADYIMQALGRNLDGTWLYLQGTWMAGIPVGSRPSWSRLPAAI